MAIKEENVKSAVANSLRKNCYDQFFAYCWGESFFRIMLCNLVQTK